MVVRSARPIPALGHANFTLPILDHCVSTVEQVNDL
jgi:hypothetical protein